MKPEDYEIEEQQTLLEMKLEKIGEQMGKYALAASVLSAVTHGAFLVCRIMFDSELSIFSNETLLLSMKVVIEAVVLLIVSLPDGLPLAISIAMALSVGKLKENKILIKNIESIQNCALLHEIGVSKTGTLTMGELKVKKFHIAEKKKAIENTCPTYFS